MMKHRVQIGFSQRVRLEWYESTANLVLAGNDEASIYRILDEMLNETLSVGGNARRGTREKVITILMKIWVRPPRHLEDMKREGLQFLQRLSRQDRITVHWGMTMAVYPFWGTVAAYVGRLLRLQGTATAGQVQRRVREQFGERSTVTRATQRVLRSFIDWGVLQETSERGSYAAGSVLDVTQRDVIAWLVEAALHTHQVRAAPLGTVLESTSLFPFRLSYLSPMRLVAESDRLDLLRYDLNQELITSHSNAPSVARSGGI